MCGPRLVVENFSMFLVRTYCMLTHAKFPQKLEFILSTEQICNSRKMSAMLRFRLKDKLPKPVHLRSIKSTSLFLKPVKITAACNAIFAVSGLKAEPIAQTAI